MSVEKLEKLAKLKEKGVITQEEFELQKKEILENFAKDESAKAKMDTQGKIASNSSVKEDEVRSLFSIIGSLIRVCFGIFCILTIYFAPTGVALCRNRLNTSSVFMLNLFLGWTLVAWVVALCWAFSSDAVDVYNKLQRK